MQTGISILLRKDISEEAGLFDFLTPFTPETWVGILVAYVATAACIFLVTRFVRQLVVLELLVSKMVDYNDDFEMHVLVINNGIFWPMQTEPL